MGIYSEYLDKAFDWPALNLERKRQLKKISEIRNRPVLAYASALTKHAPVSIGYEDRISFLDQLGGLSGSQLDLILETPGGSAEVVEDLVKNLRGKFSELAIIVPGWAKSAGTIMVMSADEILMGPGSALGPIDAQISQNGKYFAAHAFLQGLEKIKDEVNSTQQLNKAYIPILQNISPGEIQGCVNALDFAKVLVTDWLCAYKFKFWEKHSNTEVIVTQEEKQKRAQEIAEILCDHGYWKTHGRSITLADLTGPYIRLKVTNYTTSPELNDAIQRYYTLLEMTFNTTNIYKVFETPESQIFMFVTPQSGRLPKQGEIDSAIIDFQCPNCQTITKIHAVFKPNLNLQEGAILFPADNNFICPSCNSNINLSDLRKQIESEAKRKIL